MSTPFPSRSEMISGSKKTKKKKSKKTIIENIPDIPIQDPEYAHRTPYAIPPVGAKSAFDEGTSVCPIYVSDFEDSSEVAVRDGEYKYRDFVTKPLPVVSRGRPQDPRTKKESKPSLSTEEKKANKKKKRLEMKKRIATLSSRSKSRDKPKKSEEPVHVDVTALDQDDDPVLERELEEITLNGRRSGLISGTPEKDAYDIENGKPKGWRKQKQKWGKKLNKVASLGHRDDDDDKDKSWLLGTLFKDKNGVKQRMAKQRMTHKMVALALILISIIVISVGIANKGPKPGKLLTAKQQQIQTIIFRITGEKTLTEAGTAQNRARNWLLYEDTEVQKAPVQSEEGIIQRFALASFYFATSGESGKKSTWTENNWLKGPECGDENHDAWFGVNCNSDGDVRALALDNWGLSGTIPPELGHLYKLENLILKNNPDLIGWIPVSFSHLANLRQLGLYNNNLSGVIPDIFEHTKSLKFINLENNDIHGSIPLEISHLASLETLVLKNNRMEGIVPFEQLASTGIKYLGLSNNRFASRIERVISEVDTLEYLYLDNNELRGTVPPHIGGLSHLKAIDLGNNAFTGFFPGTVGNLERLEYLSLNNNKFNRNLPLRISLLTNLSKFFLVMPKIAPEKIGD
jgi:hypothetical protein